MRRWRLRFETRSRAEPLKSAGHLGQYVVLVLEEQVRTGKDDPSDVFWPTADLRGD